MTHSPAEVELVQRLHGAGYNQSEIARMTGINRTSVREWIVFGAFLQGPGRKHERPIELVAWQRELVEEWPHELLRGLIHSDGCRCINKVKTNRYGYSRYLFTNASADIRGLFCWACDLLGVEWRQMNARNISVARRASVEYLDAFIGPKT